MCPSPPEPVSDRYIGASLRSSQNMSSVRSSSETPSVRVSADALKACEIAERHLRLHHKRKSASKGFHITASNVSTCARTIGLDQTDTNLSRSFAGASGEWSSSVATGMI